MNNKLENEIKELLNSQLGLTKVLNDSEYIIEGVYKYSLCHDGYITQGEKNIKLKVKEDFPNSIPEFYVYDYPEGIEHIYQDGKVCLATIGEMIYFLNENTSLIAFIEKFVNAFIYTLDWFEKYKTYPFGDRRHGYKGALDYYLNDLKFTKEEYNKIFLYFIICNNKYKGHMPCICGSGKMLRKCHGKYILPIVKNDSYKKQFREEIAIILTEDGKNVRKES